MSEPRLTFERSVSVTLERPRVVVTVCPVNGSADLRLEHGALGDPPDCVALSPGKARSEVGDEAALRVAGALEAVARGIRASVPSGAVGYGADQR